MKPVPLLIGLLILAEGRLSTSAEECDHSENMLVPGHWYQYEFDVKAEAASVGSTDDVSEMDLTCQVKVSHIGTCKYLFEVQKCDFSSGGGPPGNKDMWIDHDDLSEMANFPVVVSLSGGVVAGLEVSPSESEHILNIKRALISAFVLKKSHMREGGETSRVDIHGTCPWKMWSGTEPRTAHSSKDMLYCAYPERADWNLSPWAIMWNMHFIQYLINSTVDCTYVSSENVDYLESLRCHERHAIKLESTHSTTTAVQTNIFYKMSLKTQGTTGMSSDDFGDLLDLVPAGIAYKHLPSPDPTLAKFDANEKASLNDALRNQLADLVQTAETEIRLFTIPLFHKLVELLRKSNDLVDFVDSVANCNRKPDDVDVDENLCTQKWKTLAMSFLQDALIQSNTVPTLRAFRHLVTNGHVNDAYLPLPFHSWSFLRNNDTRYLEEVFVLPIFNTVLRHITTFLGRNCDVETVPYPSLYSKPQKMNYLIMMLKALKNAGVVAQIANPGLEGTLLACAQNRDLPVPVAVFAIEAMHEFRPTYNTLSTMTRGLLSDRTRPWELRIAVYKLLTKEPDRWKFGKAVANALDSEPRHSELVDFAISDFLDSLPSELKTALEQGKSDSDSIIPGEKLYTSEKHYGGTGTGKIRKSNRRTFERQIKLPFMPTELSNFAVKTGSEEIFGGWRNLLSDFSRNVTMQLFGTEFHFADMTIFFKGTDLTFSSYGDIMSAFISMFMPPEPLHELLKHPRSVDVTRTIRIIEAYHQVPTMMGLPLNWTTSATLVASMRTEAHQTSPSNLAVKLHPRRTNQMIKHDRFEEMGDWNVQRVNVNWCTGDALGGWSGVQFCHDRSYANVTHLMRPWFLMTAPASWQFVLKPYSE
ncbi:hypothetical protein V5799_032331 [Amblyomma americanum]|uniref:Vitellogenin domain-containing protein n=1 Tax=Amblyomma americanum TaxID=6943 RepID=A0AAQ4DRH5_AMBAM